MSDFWKLGMQSHTSREAQMRARVAETSISAARVVDAFENPEVSIRTQLHETRIAAGPMRSMAHADLKHCSGGSRSTFAAAQFYLDAARERREALLAAAQNVE